MPPFQGLSVTLAILTQGCALGFHIAPQGVHQRSLRVR
jgi:hypothetical protein